MIKDSGNRTEFASGAVRDIQEGKGRCDLLPLGVAASCIDRPAVLTSIDNFMAYNELLWLRMAIAQFCVERDWDIPTMLLEVAVHFEEGAKKYGERNWQKGIPVSRYIDSAVRHYLKFRRGDDDERHDRAFCWNIICAIWTCLYMPELNEYKEQEMEGDLET